MQIDGLIRAFASEPAKLFDHLPLILLAWLIYRMHVRNDQNFREVVKVIKEVASVIGENSAELKASREQREDEHDHHHHHQRRHST